MEPFARTMELGERKSPSRDSDLRESLRYVEDLNAATCLREALRRRQGTPLAAFFSTLLGQQRQPRGWRQAYGEAWVSPASPLPFQRPYLIARVPSPSATIQNEAGSQATNVLSVS